METIEIPAVDQAEQNQDGLDRVPFAVEDQAMDLAALEIWRSASRLYSDIDE